MQVRLRIESIPIPYTLSLYSFTVLYIASIIAKVTRDHLLENWKWCGIGSIDNEYGSGYPSDEICVNWYEDLHPLLSCLLFSFPSPDLSMVG